MVLPPSTSTLTLPSPGLVAMARTVDKVLTGTVVVWPFTTAVALKR